MRPSVLALAAALLAGAGGTPAQPAPVSAAAPAASAAATASVAARPARAVGAANAASAPAPSAASASSAASAGPSSNASFALQPSTGVQPLPRGDAAGSLPVTVRAQRISSQLDMRTLAEGDVEFRRGGLVIRADQVTYDTPLDLANAKGKVRITRDGAIYSGPELQLRVQRFEGFFLQPEFEFPLLASGGRAERIDFFDSARSRATRAEYTSCPRDTPDEPAWLLRADSVRIDLETNTGVADGAVLRFLGTPILGWPSLSFPLSDDRKSGWLPPSVTTDNRTGVEVSAPWYWNIAPNRDATFTPRVSSRRGAGIDSEFRYLEPRYSGKAQFDWLPKDLVAERGRWAAQWLHEGQLLGSARYSVDLLHVSDDDWWKDFPDRRRSLSARLLPTRLAVEQPFSPGGAERGEGLAYARLVQWQVLQGSDQLVTAPYERTPQIGARYSGRAAGLEYGLEGEFNRFTLPSGADAQAGRVGGERLHALGHVAYPWRQPGWWLVPRLSVNAATYSNEANANKGPGLLPNPDQRSSRVIPTFSVDLGLELERQTQAFGRAVEQTVEPRLLYVRTPYRQQRLLPNYDSAAKDFNFVSIYSDNQFSGVDRVSDGHQLTAGVTTRFVDSASGAEALRLGLVQRYLFRTQYVTPQADGTPDGPPLEQRFSDALLLGSTSVIPNWTLDAAVQYSPDEKRSVRTITGARYSPGPYRTVNATYRLARGLSEQMELGWQWPIWGQPRDDSAPRNSNASSNHSSGSSNSCSGTWYSVGRVNYSLKDSRVTDSVFGVEYDAGCWIGRFVAERLSTGRSEATTRFMLQLELVGLSRLGSNPLKVLKDNIPGYRLLREERRSMSNPDDRQNVRFYD